MSPYEVAPSANEVAVTVGEPAAVSSGATWRVLKGQADLRFDGVGGRVSLADLLASHGSHPKVAESVLGDRGGRVGLS